MCVGGGGESDEWGIKGGYDGYVCVCVCVEGVLKVY